MRNCNLKEVPSPYQKITVPLTELLRNGARDLIKQAVEADLGVMLSEYAKGLSANTVSRLKSQWLNSQHQGLSQKRYVYWWADGI